MRGAREGGGSEEGDGADKDLFVTERWPALPGQRPGEPPGVRHFSTSEKVLKTLKGSVESPIELLWWGGLGWFLLDGLRPLWGNERVDSARLSPTSTWSASLVGDTCPLTTGSRTRSEADVALSLHTQRWRQSGAGETLPQFVVVFVG